MKYSLEIPDYYVLCRTACWFKVFLKMKLAEAALKHFQYFKCPSADYWLEFRECREETVPNIQTLISFINYVTSFLFSCSESTTKGGHYQAKTTDHHGYCCTSMHCAHSSSCRQQHKGSRLELHEKKNFDTEAKLQRELISKSCSRKWRRAQTSGRKRHLRVFLYRSEETNTHSPKH